MMRSSDRVESIKSYSFKRHILKTKNTIEERWIKRIHYYHYRSRLFLKILWIEIVNCCCFFFFWLGIEPNGNHVDAPTKFHVETFAAGKGNVDVVVINPKGQREKVNKKTRNFI